MTVVVGIAVFSCSYVANGQKPSVVVDEKKNGISLKQKESVFNHQSA